MFRKTITGISLLLLFSCSSSVRSLKGVKAKPSPGASIIEELQISTSLQNKTGIYLLEGGAQSLFARLWLIDRAQDSIDIQYYSVAKDITGILVSERLVRAADRGVKVRLLIDDAASRIYNRAVRLLDSHVNIEVRVYNAGLKLGSLRRRLPHLVKNGARLLRRMHNKNITIDGIACVTGGRNIADEYFDHNRKYNFRDRDVLLVGRAVQEAAGSFDLFWNDPLTVTYTKLSPKVNRKRYRKTDRFDHLYACATDTTRFSNAMRNGVVAFADTLRKARQTGQFAWVSDVQFVSDKPGKNEGRDKREGSATTDTLLNLVRAARRTIDIQTPYFITTKVSSEAFSAAIKRGVRIRVLTNSLASIDNFEPFGAYQKCRKEIFKMGIELYEFRPDAKVRDKLILPELKAKLKKKSVYGFHPKTIIIDSSVVVAGSYNLDPRSANYNTECIAVIRSREVALALQDWVEEEFKEENAWKVSPGNNPDKKAPLIKRLKAFWWRILPKKLL